MLFSIDLNNPKSIPFMLKRFHFEELAPILDTLNIDFNLSGASTISYSCKDNFFNWFVDGNHIKELEDEEWETKVTPEDKSIQLVFTNGFGESAAKNMGTKFGTILKMYSDEISQ